MVLRRNWLYKENLKNWKTEPKTITELMFQTLGTFTGFLAYPWLIFTPKDSRRLIKESFIYLYSFFNFIVLVTIIVLILRDQTPQNLLKLSLILYCLSSGIIIIIIFLSFIASSIFEIFEKLEIWFEPIKEKIKQSKLCNGISKFNELFKIKWK